MSPKYKYLIIIFCFISLGKFSAGQIENPKTRWRFQTQGAIRSAAIVDANQIYFGSSDGFVYALNKSTGDLRWKFQTNGAITGAPAIYNSVLIVSSRSNDVFALDYKTGQRLWSFHMGPLLQYDWGWEYFTAAPVIENDKVFAGSGDGNLYALRISNGKLLWKFQTKGRIRASPAIHEETIYQPSFDGIIYAINKETGKLILKLETEGAKLDSKNFFFDRNSIYTKPSIKGSVLIIGSRDGNAYCFNTNSGKEIWRFSYGPTWAMSAAIHNDAAYIGWSDNNTFCSIDLASGKEKWKFAANSLIYSTPFFIGNDIYVGSADKNLYCLDKNTGNKKWAYKVKGAIFSSPIVDSNVIYFGSDDGALYAIEEGIKPFKAIYSADSKLATYFKQKEFTQLDSAKLYKFLDDRIADQYPSVIIFRTYLIPQNIIGDHPETGLIRKYLETGGKIIWLAEIPNFITFDKNGQPNGYDTGSASKMLGVNFQRPFESGQYYSKATQVGMNWGLPPWLMTTYASAGLKDIIPLSMDEYGRPSIWLRKLNPRPGSGFVSARFWSIYEAVNDEQLSLILQLALYELE